MLGPADNPAQLYLPLLTSVYPEVRRQAQLLLVSLHGPDAKLYLRELLGAADAEARSSAAQALHWFDAPAEAGGVVGAQQLYLECLGRFRLHFGGAELPHDSWLRHCEGRAGVQKTQGLLAYLSHCGRRGASRAALDSAIWPRRGEGRRLSDALLALRSLLRELCGPGADNLLLLSDDHVTLSPELYSSDDGQFEQLFGLASTIEAHSHLEAAAPFYQQALQLYGGPYMLNIQAAATWCRARRDLLAGNFIIASERLAELAYRHRRYAQCVSLAEQALDGEPTAEELVCWLLRAHHALGHWADLEHCYLRYLRAVEAIGDTPQPGRPDTVTLIYAELKRPLAERSIGERR